jgi:alkyldihydroxyacetonephosphate synthase
MELAQALADAVPGLAQSDADVDRLAYARDLWPRHHLDIREGKMLAASRPALVAWPRTTEEVATIVKRATELGAPIVPFGAGSGVCGAILPTTRALVIDMKRMTRWRDLDPAQPSLLVESGAMGITLEEDLERKGFTAGHFPSSILCSTVGGWLAARGAGQCSGRYGKIEDMVAEIELVDGRGEISTIRRRVNGPDLVPLVIGSEGTLAIITAARLRLHPRPASRAYAAYAFPHVENGWNAMRAMFQAGLRPSVSRLYDPFDTLLARMGGVKKDKPKKKSEGMGLGALSGVLRAPKFLNGRVDAVGDRVMGGAMLILIFEGQGTEAQEDAAAAAAIASSLGATALGEGPAQRWMQHRYSVSYRQAPVFRSGAFSDTMEVAATWSRLPGLYDGVRRALGEHAFVMAHLSHAYPDGCSIYFTFAGSAKDDAGCRERYDAAWRAALDAAVAAGGTISHHHGVGRSKAPRLGAELGVGVDLVRAAMRAFDPKALMNPGNLLPSPDAPPAPSPPASGTSFAIDEASLLATVPGAMTLAEAERLLAARDLVLPIASSVARSQTVDAWIASGCVGAPDPWEDPVDHAIAGLRATLPSGAKLDVLPGPRRAAGPDLVALFVGMRGAAGRVDAVELRVRRRDEPPARVLRYTGERSPAMGPGEQALVDGLTREIARC